MTTRRISPRRTGAGHTAIAIVIIAILLFPLYWMVNASLQPSGALLSPTPKFFPSEPTWVGYETAWNTQLGHLGTSLAVAVGTVAVTLAISTPAAYALAKLRVRGSHAVVLAVLVVQMIPGIVMANALYVIYARVGLLDTGIGLVLADATIATPFAILIIRAFMQDIPEEVIEAATVDGASQLRTFRSVIVPISRNSIITAGLFAFLHAWSDFLFAITLTSGSGFAPITVGIYRFVGAQTADWNGVMATATLASIPAVILLVVAQKYIAAGVAGGAVKG